MKIKKIVAICMLLAVVALVASGCTTTSASYVDTQTTIAIANTLQESQPTPSDLDYSLERFNLIRRAYWVNGQREKAMSLPCPITRPLGYITLIAGNAVVGSFAVDGKVSSLNSFLTPDSEFYEKNGGRTVTYLNKWLADVDGSYGVNDNGIFFFTPSGNYIEWTGEYLFSDIPMHVDSPIVRYEVNLND